MPVFLVRDLCSPHSRVLKLTLAVRRIRAANFAREKAVEVQDSCKESRQSETRSSSQHYSAAIGPAKSSGREARPACVI